MPLDYPEAVPSREIKQLFEMLTGKKPANLNQALHYGWLVQGYLQGLIWPVEQSVDVTVKVKMASGYRVPKLQDHEALAALGALAGIRKSKAEIVSICAFEGVSGSALKSEIAKILLPILLDWLKKWVTGGGLEKLIERLAG